MDATGPEKEVVPTGSDEASCKPVFDGRESRLVHGKLWYSEKRERRKASCV